MINQELAEIFYQMAEFLEMQDVEFKPRAYEKVARILESMAEGVDEIYKVGGHESLEKIPGVGESIAEKIEEYLKTNRIKEYEQLKKKCPVKLEELMKIEGLGPKTIKTLYQKLKIKNLRDLERAAKAEKIRGLEHFGEKTEQNILRGIEFVKKNRGRVVLGFILPLVRKLETDFSKLSSVKKVIVAGSARRRQETVGDLDILVASEEPIKVTDFFVAWPEVERVYSRGPTKTMVRLKNGLDADLRVVPEKSFGSALQYFTGNKDHNIAMRCLAREKSLKLNEYGVFRNGKYLVGRTEEDVYRTLDLPYIEPELRQDSGEIEAALKGRLPKIIGYNEIKGDLHVHTDWSDGSRSIEEMAREGMKLNYQYMAITDHVGHLQITNSLDQSRILKQWAEIDKLNKKFQAEGLSFRLLKGAETNIRQDGGIDLDDDSLAKFEVVLASVHSHFRMSKKEMTERICRALRHPYVDILAHPTGRVIQQREAYLVDLDKVFAVAKEVGKAIEVNAYAERLDLNDVQIRKAIAAGVKLVISTDAHNKEQLHFMELGIAQARRGWAEKKDILNAQFLASFLKSLS